MDIPESRRRKLDLLLRRRAQGEIVSGEELLERLGHGGVNRPRVRRQGWVAAQAIPVPANQPLEPLELLKACPGQEAADARGGRCWLIERSLPEVEPTACAIAREYAAVLAGARHRFDELEASPGLCHAADAGPQDLLFMDTETCGLAGAMIFLVGMMHYRDGELVFSQYLARDYSEEPAILETFARRFEQAGVLVTFNGKSFDMTQIRERWAFHGVQPPWNEPPHLDLLHESRRRWKGQLRRFGLQHLEWRLLGRHRAGDIPGAAIPDAYHHFVRTGDARQVRDILHHNLLDLLTMAQLVTILLTGCDPVKE